MNAFLLPELRLGTLFEQDLEDVDKAMLQRLDVQRVNPCVVENTRMSFSLNYASLEHPKWKNLPPPPDFAIHATSTKSAKAAAAATASYAALKEKRAWDLAISPAKSLPMQALMLYMSGGGVQIFSMGIVVMLLLSPVKNVLGMRAAFAPFEPSPSALVLQKATYVLCNVLTLAVGLWKCRSMGLLPTGTADWLAFETRGIPPEMSL